MAISIAGVLKSRRADLGMSQVALADKAGINVRQIVRYEKGEQQPVLSVAVALADALTVSLEELAGGLEVGIDLSGWWWAGWQQCGTSEIRVWRVQAHQNGLHLELFVDQATVGEFRLWNSAALIGWYSDSTRSVRTRGAAYLALVEDGLVGYWSGET